MVQKALHCIAFFLLSFTILSNCPASASDNQVHYMLGLEMGIQSNLFQERGLDGNSVFITRMTGGLEFKHRVSPRSYIQAELMVRQHIYSEFGQANYPQFQAEILYRLGGTKMSAAWETGIDRLLYVSDKVGDVMYDEQDFGLSIERELPLDHSLRFEAIWGDEDYIENASGRNQSSRKLGLRWKYKKIKSFTPQIGFRWGNERAEDTRYSMDRQELWFGASASVKQHLGIYSKYRIRFKDYITEDASNYNFGRADTVHTFVIEARIPVIEHLDIVVKESYEHGNSSRLDRNYSDNVFTLQTELTF
ncbi:hypothetical protein ACFLU6_05280 [Acidobacteriota bacterium]